MDSPGRAELLGMQGHMGYTSCCVCKHCFSAGIGTAKTCNFDGYRRFLKRGSRGRRKRVHYCSHTYEYEDDETRLKPKFRDDTFVRTAVAFVKQRHAPFLGHKGTPMLARWPGFNWYRMNPPDIMHGTFTLYIQAQCILTRTLRWHATDCKVVVEMIIKVIVGKWLGVYEDNDGGYKSWSRDPKHRREAEATKVFRNVWPDRNGRLPWRLTKEELKVLDKRLGDTVWPHYMDRLHYDGCSFWVKPGRLWKTRRKVVNESFACMHLTSKINLTSMHHDIRFFCYSTFCPRSCGGIYLPLAQH